MSHLWMLRPNLEQIPAAVRLGKEYQLRELRDQDDPIQLAETLAGAFEYPWTTELVRAKLIDAPDVLATYIIVWQDRIIATASSRWLADRYPRSGYVHWVGVHPSHARRGLATALVIRLLEDFTARGYENALLETDDFRIPAIKAYFKLGFVPVYEVGDEDHRVRWSTILPTLFQ